MNRILSLLTLLTLLIAAGAPTLTAPAAEADRLRSELVGQTMGGREKCWKFQSVEQIKDVDIKNRKEFAQTQVYTVTLKLQAGKNQPVYQAEARVEYQQTNLIWRIRQVGLLSLAKAK